MDAIKFFKVTSLPAVLEPNSVYFVNTAGILNVHVSDNTGADSIQLSGGSGGGGSLGTLPYVIRKESPKIAGDYTNDQLATVGLVTRRLYMVPFVTPRNLTLTKLRINVTNQSTSGTTVSIGIYNNINIANGNDNPYQLLTSVVGLSTVSNGDKDAVINFTFLANTLYWIGLIGSSAPTLRAVKIQSQFASLGRLSGSNTAVTHLYKNYATFALPALGPTDLLSGIDSIPAVYLVE